MKHSYDVSPEVPKIPYEFVARRLQSIAGFAFFLFLCEHLFTNSQATLFLGDDGRGFIDAVNWIHSLPYLQVLEITLIGLPLLIHVWWGIQRLYIAKCNSMQLPYTRNIAFTWQRITSILLIVAIGLHVYYMRFLKQPQELSSGIYQEYVVKLSVDPGLYTIAPRLNLRLFDEKMIEKMEKEQKLPFDAPFEKPHVNLEKQILQDMEKHKPGANEVLVLADNVGAPFLMVLRDTYKSMLFCVLYSIFVVIASFHGANGLWTFAITWGVSLSERSRVVVRYFSNILLVLLLFMGLACIWGVYWINLRY